MTDSNSFQLIEHCDTDALQACIDTGYIWKNDIQKYKAYHKQASMNDGEVTVTYKRKCMNGNYYGRFWPQGKNTCCARMWSPVRSEVFGGNTLDIDMVNCVPSIMANVLSNHDIVDTYIHEYAKDRSSFFPFISINQDQVDAYNQRTYSACTIKDMCKHVVISYMFGGTPSAVTKKFGFSVTLKGKAKKLIQQIKTFTTSILSFPEFKQIVSDIKAHAKTNKDKIHNGKILSHILFNLESDYVLKAMNAFKEAGLKICAYIYDGFQVYSTDKVEVDKVLDRVNSTLPGTITFINKPFNTKCTDLVFDVPETEPMEFTTDAAKMQVIEQIYKDCVSSGDYSPLIEYMNHYYCTIQGGAKRLVVEITHGTHTTYTTRLVSSMKDYFVSKEQRAALSKWLGSDSVRKYRAMQWIPHTVHDVAVPPDVLNTFSGFLQPVIPEKVGNADMRLVQPWLEHFETVWAGGDPVLYKYILSLLASMVQRPDKKLGVAVVLKSDEEGVGKNTPLDFFSQYVFGMEHVRQVTQLEHMFDKFNADAERCIMTVCDEIGSRGASYKNAGTLKSLITQTQQTIQIKGIDKSVKPDYNRYFFTSNEDWIIMVSASDRRFLCMEVSSCKVGDTQYFNNLHKFMSLESGCEMFHYLLGLDISDFNARNIPMTEWKRSLKDNVIEQSNQPLCLMMKVAAHLKTNKLKELTYTVAEVISLFGTDLKRLGNNRNGAVTKRIKKILGLTKLTSKKKHTYTYDDVLAAIRKQLQDSNWEPHE